MNSNYKISKYEAISFFLIIIINKIILNLPKEIIKQTGTGALINTFFTGILAIIFVIIISKLFKNFKNEDIIDISDYTGGKFLKILVSISYIGILILVSSTVLFRFCDLLQVVYFRKTPYLYIMIFFLSAACIANQLGLKSILKTNFIIVPFILLSEIFFMFGIGKYISISGLYPIFGNNIKETLLKGTSNIYAYGGIAYLFFLMPLLKEKKDFKKFSIISIFISALFLSLTVFALLTVFPFITHTEENISVYILVRLAQFGSFLQRSDALFIFLWIISTFSYLSITTYLILNILKKTLNLQDSKELSYSIIGIILGISLLIKEPTLLAFLEEKIYKYYLLLLIFIISPFILILGNIKYKSKHNH